ncbi:hypothetical protein HPSA50_0978 [Helicobacter pylori SouthAfrica50]|uniref:Uncharacterized protein n=1 Tax=Helicobacter pylori SouthAfrica50 TaxID=1352357 RepID=T2S8C0_HELPX|nr:hypothetical protein HPSA50_0978 [Helicobacter pylori SouthAfrica50]
MQKAFKFLNFFISLRFGYFWLRDTKTFIFKNGIFLFYHFKICFI